jgi:hypothetical protein
MGAAIGDVLGLAAGVAVNPKNGGLTIAAAATIAGAGLAGGEQAVTLAVFVLIGSVGVLAPLVVYLVAGEHAARPSTPGERGPPTTTPRSWPSCSWSSGSSSLVTASPSCSEGRRP